MEAAGLGSGSTDRIAVINSRMSISPVDVSDGLRKEKLHPMFCGGRSEDVTRPAAVRVMVMVPTAR